MCINPAYNRPFFPQSVHATALYGWLYYDALSDETVRALMQ